MNARDWWPAFYDDVFADVVLETLHAETVDATVAFLVGVLGAGAGSRVLDQGCGVGRLAVPLARRGVFVVGVDQSAEYVRRARAAAGDAGVRCAIAHGDAERFVAPEPCDGAFNWATSFGHAESDARNVAMLRAAHDSLRPGGCFALDYPNVPGVLARFAPVMISRHVVPAGEVRVVRESSLDLRRGTLDQTWTYEMPSGERIARRGSTRLYAPHEIVRLLEEAGFGEVELAGSLRCEPLTLESERCIALARRPS